jgi:predicted DNA-binding transcriptional regulator AlpA
MAYTLSRDPRLTVAEICAYLGIARATFYRYVTLARQEMEDTRR